MKAPDGEPILAWFAELPSELSDFDGFDLLAHAQHAMTVWEDEPSAAIDAVVAVTAQKLQYEAAVGGVEMPQNGGEVRQRFAAAMDETGARVIVETFIVIGLPPSEAPATFEFGARGPVLVWFTEPTCAAPFSVLFTTKDAWPKPVDEIDLDEVELPA